MIDSALQRLRLALALGDQEREQRLRPALDADPELVVAAQCLAADQLLAVVQARQVDAVLLAWGLHRLSEDVVAQLDRSGLPWVLLAPAEDFERWQARRGVVLPLDADAATVRAGIKAAMRGDRLLVQRERPRTEPSIPGPRQELQNSEFSVIAIAGGHGSPGRTTLAINLAAALGAVAPTILVDADLSSPSVLAYLDSDPSRNICTLAHAVRESAHAWGRALRDELQPLSTRSPAAQVLCGLPKPEMRSGISAGFIERLVAELAGHSRYVVLDVGAELLGIESAPSVHRAALASAHHVLLVASAELVGLWQARTELAQLERQLQLDRDRLSLVLNRYDARHHHARAEIEWHFGLAAAAVIPHDYPAAQRAVAAQRPLVLDRSSRAARAILSLAERIHQGRVHLPAEPQDRGRSDWIRRVWPSPTLPWRAARPAEARAPVISSSLTADDHDRRSAW